MYNAFAGFSTVKREGEGLQQCQTRDIIKIIVRRIIDENIKSFEINMGPAV